MPLLKGISAVLERVSVLCFMHAVLFISVSFWLGYRGLASLLTDSIDMRTPVRWTGMQVRDGFVIELLTEGST